MAQELLKPLNDLSYLLECAALDYTGELKAELASLCQSARSEYGDIPWVAQSLPKLEMALKSYCAGHEADGARHLAAISRSWWAAVAA